MYIISCSYGIFMAVIFMTVFFIIIACCSFFFYCFYYYHYYYHHHITLFVIMMIMVSLVVERLRLFQVLRILPKYLRRFFIEFQYVFLVWLGRLVFCLGLPVRPDLHITVLNQLFSTCIIVIHFCFFRWVEMHSVINHIIYPHTLHLYSFFFALVFQ